MDKQDEIDNLRRHVSLLREENQQLLDEIAVLRYRLARAGVVDESPVDADPAQNIQKE